MPNTFSRRTFARLLGISAGTAALPAFGSAAGSLGTAREPEPGTPHRFPEGFVWGSATASYQVEGAVHADGRGVSIWDTFSHTAGKTFDGDTGDVADDDYHLYREDVRLMKDLGLHACRFSIAWPRIFPNGTGAPNPKGLDFYNRVVDELLAHGIQPFCTLYHWDLPQALEDRNGGWQSRDTSAAFAQYAGYVAAHLSDRVKHFMTTNEIRTFTELGYRTGTHAPGLRLDEAQFAQVCHNAVLGHGMAVQAVRANSRAGTQVGLAENISAITPVLNTPEHIEAAALAMREENAPYMTVIQEGRYTDTYLRRLGPNAPRFTPEDLKIISGKLDFSGINIYQPTYIRADGSDKGYAIVPPPASYPHMYSPWITIGPEALYWAPKIAAKLWSIPAVYITENGASSADVLTSENTVLDTDRVMYLRNYLTHLHRGVSEGVPVKGYFLWSLLDNYEWADGYEKRFGIHYVDFKTQKRTPKLSAAFYKDVIARNALG